MSSIIKTLETDKEVLSKQVHDLRGEKKEVEDALKKEQERALQQKNEKEIEEKKQQSLLPVFNTDKCHADWELSKDNRCVKRKTDSGY